jgi:methylation protein EvaC
MIENKKIIKFLDLGKQPLANSFLEKKNLHKKEYFYNLSVGFNPNNYLVSILNPANPKKQYTNKYAHRASQSKTMRKKFKETSIKLKIRFKPNLTLEIGSNDGAFIKNFNKKKCVAVEPCKNLAVITKLLGYKTYDKFWNRNLSNNIKRKYGNIDLIFSANTISHIPNTKETFDSIESILSNDGVLVIEDPYIGNILRLNSYDQFYDEHVYVFSIISISNVAKKSGLRIFDCEKIDNHGGSMRYYLCKINSKFKETKKLKSKLVEEYFLGFNKISTYKNFAKRVIKSKKKLINILKDLKKKNKNIISYGATYKSTTIFNYCKISRNYLDCIIDTTINKQNKYSPGMHIPIISPEEGMTNKVNYAFLGAWNFNKEIFQKEKLFFKRGGKFITHVPYPRIIGINKIKNENYKLFK